MDSLECLRSMIIEQRPARLDYQTGTSRHNLHYNRSGFAGTHQEITGSLRQLFRANRVELVHTDDNETTGPSHVFAPQALSLALAGYSIDEQLRSSLLQFARQLPALSVSLYPMQRYAFQDNAAYIKMHQQYEQDGAFDMHTYITGSDSPAEEAIRLRVMIATYALGLVSPVSATPFERFKRAISRIRKSHEA